MPGFERLDFAQQYQQGRETETKNRLNSLALQSSEIGLDQQQQAAKRNDAINQKIGKIGNVKPQGREGYLGELASQGQQGLKMAKEVRGIWEDMDDRERELYKESVSSATKMLMLAKDPATYDVARQQAIEQNPDLAEQLPKQWSEETAQIIQGQINKIRTVENIINEQKGTSKFSGIADREDLIARLPKDEDGNLITDPKKMTAEQYAAAVEARVIPAAGTVTGKERIATDKTLGDQVIDHEKDLAQAKKFAELTGASRAKTIDEADGEIRKLETNIRNLDEAYQALEDGGESGPVISKWTPTLRAETQRLENARGKLGLDVVGSVTFGALSEAELDMALAVALPNLPPKELKQWIRDRQAAQQKLIRYYDDQIEHLDSGGTVASFRRLMERKKNGGIDSRETDTGTDTQQTDTNEQPPLQGAKKAPDGNWYVEVNGKWNRVD